MKRLLKLYLAHACAFGIGYGIGLCIQNPTYENTHLGQKLLIILDSTKTTVLLPVDIIYDFIKPRFRGIKDKYL